MTNNIARLKEKFLEYYRELPVQKLAGESIGKCEDTIIDWKKADSNFSDQIMAARAEWAKQKSKGVKSKEWLLERVINDHFKQKTEVEHTGKLVILNTDGLNQRAGSSGTDESATQTSPSTPDSTQA